MMLLFVGPHNIQMAGGAYEIYFQSILIARETKCCSEFDLSIVDLILISHFLSFC